MIWLFQILVILVMMVISMIIYDKGIPNIGNHSEDGDSNDKNKISIIVIRSKGAHISYISRIFTSKKKR